MAGYYTLTTADNGKLLGFPLLRSDGNRNDFTGAVATLCLRDPSGNLLTRGLVWNPAMMEWEYAVRAGEFEIGRWRCMVAVNFPGPIGPVYSSEAIFDVIAAD